MAGSYRLLTTDERTFPLADPSIATMRAVYALEVQTPFVDRASRLDVCRMMGWPEDRVNDDVAKDVYLARLAAVLFPTATVGNGDELNVTAVLEGRRDFLSALR